MAHAPQALNQIVALVAHCPCGYRVDGPLLSTDADGMTRCQDFVDKAGLERFARRVFQHRLVHRAIAPRQDRRA